MCSSDLKQSIVEGGRRKRAKFESSVSKDLCSIPLHSMDCLPISCTGTAFVCPTADACGDFEFISFTCSQNRTPATRHTFHSSFTTCLLEPTISAVTTQLRQWLRAAWHVLNTGCSRPSHSRRDIISSKSTIDQFDTWQQLRDTSHTRPNSGQLYVRRR